MSNLFKNLQPKAKLHKNGFDLSQRHLYTQSAGELIPSLCIDCIPNDHFEINLANLVRTMPLNTAAYTRIKWYHHFFFVPYSILWSNWDSFITQRTNNYSTNANGSKYVPYFNVAQVMEQLKSVGNDIFGYSCEERAAKLFDHLGYGTFYPGEWEAGADYAINANLFRLAAYNKIWYDYYRNPYYDNEENISRVDYLWEWNFDDLDCLNASSARLDISTASILRNNSNFLGHMFTPKYRQWKKDLLTSLLPDTQFGSVSFVPVGEGYTYLTAQVPAHPQNLLVGIAGSSQSGGADYNELGYALGNTISNTTVQSTPFKISGLDFDVLSLRKAEMLQRWRETTLRAGQQALKQYDAHFGVRPRHTVDHTAEFIGGVDQVISIDDVVTTSNDLANGTSTAYGAGEIFGKGISTNRDGHIKFDASEFGVLMCISSFLPEADYRSRGMDANNSLFEPFDFFTPEFQDIGMQPVTAKVFDSDRPLVESNGIVGYAPRYWNYKTAIDKIHGGFIESDNVANLGNWVTPRTDYNNFYQGLTRKALYVNPAVLDPIFSMSYDGSVSRDQFLCNDYFDIKAIRPMSVLGLPTW